MPRQEDEDVACLKQWWSTLVATEPPPPDMRGLWFGLIEVGKDRPTGVRLYTYGLADFDPTDSKGNWFTGAFWEGLEPREPYWWPRGRDVQLPGWQQIRDYDWPQALGRAFDALASLHPWTDLPGLEIAGVSFDDGDPYVVWTRDPIDKEAVIWKAPLMLLAAEGVVR